jgi:hypothetical protein
MEEQTSSSATISSNIIGVDVNALGDASNEQAPFYELTATDHINKQLLEKFKDHLEHNVVKVVSEEPEQNGEASGWSDDE